eukprot:TRINITY_DN5748_c2_g1_i3.p2 TRINITY_DN5748_c2_g1~~TRINITY_DN5748_c2_g1_i3.p2  ORF type:complete len:295 (+),score=50.85 TRINITY_DN5748_c2_g1_i3:1276-2160(+)
MANSSEASTEANSECKVASPTVTKSPFRLKKSGPHKLSKDQRAIRDKVVAECEKNGILPMDDPHKLNDEDSVTRALIARNWDKGVTMTMLKHVNKWRRKEKVNDISSIATKKFNKPLRKYVDCALYGVDNDGYPILWQNADQKKVERLLSDHGHDGAVLLNTYIIERCREAAKLLNVDRFSIVLNLSTISASVLMGSVGQVLRAQVKATQQVYPENMRRCIIYNPPFVFRMIWSTIEILLDARVREKIKIGGNHIHELVPKKTIPPSFGGKAKVNWDKVQMTLHDKQMEAHPSP